MENVYFDNSATTRIDEEVLREMMPFFKENYGNASSIYKLGRTSKKAIEESREKIAKAIKISRKCLRIVYENTYFAIGIKLICLVLGAVGIANMWLAIFADVGVMVIAVLNAIRALFVHKL